MNVYIIGQIKGSYRTQNLIKFLLDNNYSLFFNTLIIGNSLKEGNSISKIFRIILRAIEEILKTIFNIYFIAISDIVVMPAMCNDYQRDLKIASLFGKIIYTDFYISYFDTFVLDRKISDPKSSRAKKFLNWDKNCMVNAHTITFLNNSEAKYYTNLINVDLNSLNYNILPLCVENKFDCKLPFFKENNSASVFNICWWGNYLPLHGLDKIIRSADELTKMNPNFLFHFYLFGTSDELAKPYKELINDLQLASKITIDNSKTFNNGKLEIFLKSNCDLVLGNFGDSNKAKNVLVNKLLDGVAMKAPVLTGESVAPTEFFNDGTILYTQNDPTKIAASILKISKMSAGEISDRVQKGFDVYAQNFSEMSFDTRIKKIFDKLSAKKKEYI